MNKKTSLALTFIVGALALAAFALWLEHSRSLEGFEVVRVDYPSHIVVSDGERRAEVMVKGVQEKVGALDSMAQQQVADVLNSRLSGMEVSGTYVPLYGLVTNDGTPVLRSEDLALGGWPFAAHLREAMMDVDSGRTHQQIEGVFERIGPAYIHVRGSDGEEYRLTYAHPRSETLETMTHNQEMKDAVSSVLARKWVIAESVEGCSQDGEPWYCIVEFLMVGDEEGSVEWREAVDDAVITLATLQAN